MTLRELLPTDEHARALAGFLLMPMIILDPTPSGAVAKDRTLLLGLLAALAEEDRPLSALPDLLDRIPAELLEQFAACWRAGIHGARATLAEPDASGRLARLRTATRVTLDHPLQAELAEAYIARWQASENIGLADVLGDA